MLSFGCVPPLLEGIKFDPSLTWRVIQTPHFRIYYHQGEEEAARKAARISEEVHALLTRRLNWTPAEPTHLVLTDSLDDTFGATLPIPNNAVYITLTPPLGSSVPFLIRSEDWLRQVITHEYVHVLQLDMNHGFPSVMRSLFGRNPLPFIIFNSALPNLFQPAWLIEGLAVYEETATGVSDRRDGAYTEMLIRMAVLEDRFPKIDQAGGRDTWPGNQIQYLFGGRFHEYLARRFGEGPIRDLSIEYSDNLFPLFVDTVAEQVLGAPYERLWEEWHRELRQKYAGLRQELESAGLTASTPMTRAADYQLGPKVDPGGERVAYTTFNPHEHPALHIITREGPQPRLSIDRNGGYTVSWSADGRRLVFSQPEIDRNYFVHNDLYLYDLHEKELRRLTRGERLRDPDFHPEGSALIAVESRSGEDRLVRYRLGDGEKEVLDWIEGGVTFAHPRWSPDGRMLAVSVWKKGAQGIYLIDVAGRKVSPLLMDSSLDLTPVWSPEGDFLLFSSDRTGIYNLFAYAVKSGELFQVTQLLGGAFTPEVTKDAQIVFSAYQSDGFGLHRMPWSPSSWKKIGSSSEAGLPIAPADSVPSFPEEAPDLSDVDYSPWPTLRPRFWSPLFAYDDEGWQIGAATAGMDVLGKHKFAAALIYGASTQRSSYTLQYVNDQFYPTFHAGISNFTVLLPDLVAGRDYRERRLRVDLDVTVSRLLIDETHAFTLGYRGERFSGLTDLPSALPSPPEGNVSGLRFAWRWGTAKEYRFSISPEEGRRVVAGYERFDRSLGSDFDQNRFLASWREYLSLFWRHHLLAARLTGAVARGDRLIQGAYEVGGASLSEEILDPEQIDFFLRGYPIRSLRGEKAALGSLEYRFPIRNIERALRTLPFFFERMHGTLFFDIGHAWEGGADLSQFRRGIGAEVKMDMLFAYLFPVRLRAGFARGLDEGGESQLYLTIGNSF